MANIEGLEFLAKPYVGRVVAIGLTGDERYWRQFTAIGGRSEGSRNRKYINAGDTVETAPYNPKKPFGDREKTIYTAHMSRGMSHVISNGIQTHSFIERTIPALIVGKTFEEILACWETEGKDSDYTARIVGRVTGSADRISLGRVSRNPADKTQSDYETYRIKAVRGYAFFITTYNGEGGTEPSIYRPSSFHLTDTLEEDQELFWNTLDPNTKVAAASREIFRGTGDFRYAPFKSIYDQTD